MSYTVIYRFDHHGNAVKQAWFQDAWKGAMTVWQIMEERYLPPYFPTYIQHKWWYRPGMSREDARKHNFTPTRTAVGAGNAIQEIWDLVDNPDIPFHDRIALCTTLDNILIRAEDLPLVIDAFQRFGGTTSLPQQAKVLLNLEGNEDCIAVGWDQNTISTTNWGNRGGTNHQTEQPIPYNCLTMNEHEWLMQSMVLTK